MRDNRSAVVSALGAADTTSGWREHKRDGGLVIDVASGALLARGLSMPHSPRWHDGRLWVLSRSIRKKIAAGGARSSRVKRPGRLRVQHMSKKGLMPVSDCVRDGA